MLNKHVLAPSEGRMDLHVNVMLSVDVCCFKLHNMSQDYFKVRTYNIPFTKVINNVLNSVRLRAEVDRAERAKYVVRSVFSF